MGARFQGILWLVAAGGLVVWAREDFGWAKVGLATLAFVYGVLQLVRARVVTREIALSPAELDKYGDKLSEVTPEIEEFYRKGMTVRDIADHLEARRGLPREVTIKYIIALGQQLRREQGTA